MAAYIDWTTKAKRDLKRIIRFYNSADDQSSARRKLATFVQDLNRLAVTPMLGSKVEELPGYEYWYALRSEYKVYFQRLSPTGIKIYRIRSSRQRPLEPDEIA